jgi:hypothetical protein
LEVGSSGVRLDLRYLHVGTRYLDGSKVENEDQELETHLTQQFSFFYTLSPEFTATAIVPIPSRHSEELDNGHLVTGNQFGLGDVALLVRYKPYTAHTTEATTILSLAAGVKLPTGRTDGKDSEGNLLDAHIQLGTGSTDFLVGASGFLSWGKTALIANVLGGINTKGANGHQFGNALNYDMSVRYKIYPAEFATTQLFATLGLDGEWRGRETEDDVTIDDSGGNVLYLTPGLQMFFSASISLEASFHYAVIHGLHGEQLGEDYRIMSGVQILF